MSSFRGVCIFLIGIVFSASASAGMISQSQQAESVPCSYSAEPASEKEGICDSLFTNNIDLWNNQPLPVAQADAEVDKPVAEPNPLTDGTNSLSLCLSALVGVGLISSGHWVKRLHLGFIPDWYHDGGPVQIGHSFAIMPNCLINTPVYCFVQPDSFSNKACLPQAFRFKQIVSLWRDSQFTPDAIASRGPPYIS
jgi:hypothetical protein